MVKVGLHGPDCGRARAALTPILAGLVLLLAGAPASADVTLERRDEALTARDGSLEVRLERWGEGLALAGASADGREVLRGPSVLWRAELRDRRGARVLLHGGMGPAEVAADGDTLRLSWPALPVAQGVRCAVTVTMQSVPERLEWRWRIDFAAIPEGWTLYRYVFPVLAVAATDGDGCALIEPNDWGTITPDPLTALEGMRRSYPGSTPAMQFYALQDGPALTYLGWHDPAARVKEFLWTADPAARALRLSVEQPTRLAFGVGYAQDYPFVLRALEDDWYDAAQVYREWALTAPWTWRGPLAAGAKTAADFIATPLVVMRLGPESVDPRFVADWALRVQRWFGVPMTVHLYAWHRSLGSPSIDCYPDYFPAQPGFREAVRTMEGAGIRVMPYLNARLWRTDQPSWEEAGSLLAARDIYGRLYEEVWMRVPAAAMNAASLLWREYIGQQALRCVEAGCTGIYLDQTATSRSLPSYLPAHPGVPGETAAWVEGGCALAEMIREEGAAIRPGVIVGAEGNAEPYLASVDTFLTGNLNHERSIPLYSAVYHDYALAYGRYIMDGDLALPKAVLAKFAQQAVFGGQFGWSRADLERILADGDPTAECLRALAHLRHEFADLLGAGRVLRPPALDVPELTVRWMKWDREVDVQLPQVLSSAWQAADGTVGVLLVNLGDEPMDVRIDLPTERYPLGEGASAQLHRHAPDTGLRAEELGRTGEGWRVTVPPTSPVLLTVPGEPIAWPDPPAEPAATYLSPPVRELEGVLPFNPPRETGVQGDSAAFPVGYEADELPGPDDLAWRLMGPGSTGASVGAVGGVLRIDTLTDPAARAVFLAAPHGVGWDVDPVQGYTLEARLRVLASNDDARFACWLLANTGETSTNAQLYPDRIVPLGAEPIAADMAGDMHTVRLVGMPGGQTARLYFDRTLVAEQMRVVTGTPEGAMAGVGAGASAGRIIAEIDYVRLDPSHAWLPR